MCLDCISDDRLTLDHGGVTYSYTNTIKTKTKRRNTLTDGKIFFL